MGSGVVKKCGDEVVVLVWWCGGVAVVVWVVCWVVWWLWCVVVVCLRYRIVKNSAVFFDLSVE